MGNAAKGLDTSRVLASRFGGLIVQPLAGRRRAAAIILLLAAALLVATGAHAEPPAEGLDLGYGTRGLATVGGPSSAARRLDAQVSAKYPGGGLVIAGTQFDEANGQRVNVGKLLPSGAPDTAFNGSGWVTFDTDPQSYAGGEGVCDILVQPDGAILVSTLGPSYETFQTFVYRFLPNGTRDATFSGDGKLVLSGRCRLLTLRSDGRILTTAWFYDYPVPTSQVAFQQFLADGRPDKSFDGDGVRSVRLTETMMAPYELHDVAMQGDSIVVVGSASLPPEEEGGSRSLAGLVARFTGAGAADRTFSGDGWLIRKDVNRFRDVEVAGGKPTLLGEYVSFANGYSISAVVARLHGVADATLGVKAGQWDTSFSGDGFARRAATYAQNLTIDPAGTITALGHASGYLNQSLLWRYDASGSLDTDFGGNGAVELSQCDYSLGQAGCVAAVGVHALTGNRVLVAGDALNCPDLTCNPPFNSENLYLPVRFAAVRTVADPLVAVYAETYPYAYENDGLLPVSVRLTSRSVVPVTVQYETIPGTAQPGVDYTHVSGTLTFSPGQLKKTVNVPMVDDTVYEGPSTFAELAATPVEQRTRRFSFRLLRSTVTGATVPVQNITGAVADNESFPLISVLRLDGEHDITYVNEGDGTASVSVRLSHPTNKTTWVRVETWVEGGPQEGWATPGADYVALTDHQVTFLPGEVTKTVPVTLTDDAVDEEYEAVDVRATATSFGHEFLGYVLSNRIIILDDDPAS